jgi:putative hemolysin
MKQKIIIATMLSWIIALAWCSLIPQTENWQNETPNPASVFCEENGGTLEIIPDEWGTRWNCNFDDGSFCEERAYYHGECSPGRWKGNTIEIQEIQELQDDENLSQETKEEISELVEEIQEHDSQDIDATVDDTLKKYESTWSDLQESDIELMNEIIDIVTQN